MGTGAYDVQVFLNSVLEPESFGGAPNDDLASAVDVNASAVALQGIGDRLAVTGITDAGTADLYRFDLTEGQAATLILSTADLSANLELLDGAGIRLSESSRSGPP